MEASHAKLPVYRRHMPGGRGKSTRAQCSKSKCCLQLAAPETAVRCVKWSKKCGPEAGVYLQAEF